MRKYKVVDLFAGAGGLSLGFIQTNKYNIKVAFENNPVMQETYRRNHPGVEVCGDVTSADYSEIQKRYGKIDVVIGGPPCQGFSNANRQKNHAISRNNMLIKQYIRAIRELQPMAFVMENVSMLSSDVHRFYLDESDNEIFDQYLNDIPIKPVKLVLLDRKFVFDGAIEIIQSLELINAKIWPEEHYFILNVIYKAAKNPNKMIRALEKHQKKILKYCDEYIALIKSDYISTVSRRAFKALKEYFSGSLDLEELQRIIEPAVMVQRMLSKAKELYDNHLVIDQYSSDGDLIAMVMSYAVYDYLQAILGSDPNNYAIGARVLCAADYGAPQKRNRFVVMGIKKTLTEQVHLPVGNFAEENYRTVRDAMSDLEDIIPVTEVVNDIGITLSTSEEISDLAKYLRDSDSLRNHIVTSTRETALERFKALKQGQNFHSLDVSLKTNTYTDISRTQNTIYLRLDYDQPSGTVINVRKSMWVHPELDRAVSVREAARLQTFPDSFVFWGTKDKQYQQVGNAVPPIMAKAIASMLAEQLTKSLVESKNSPIAQLKNKEV